ncbi:Rnf-Nqr domain containing protein [Zongyangia sp. HA2173]|uniref:Rnf-Nqr domain containing protein n=1 Tax=Zongyangia sp. HA2173 TaxID=3133035 RepID=UPI00315E80AA
MAIRSHLKKSREKMRLFEGMTYRNPVLICGFALAPAIMITTSLKNAVAMTLAFFVVTVPTLVAASFIKNSVPRWLRSVVYALIASVFFIPALALVRLVHPLGVDLMGIYLPILVINSVLLSRAERFARKNKPVRALIDGSCYTIGFGVVLCVVSTIREIIGAGSIWGVSLNLSQRTPAVLLPFAGFILVAFLAAFAQFLNRLLNKRIYHRSDSSGEVK